MKQSRMYNQIMVYLHNGILVKEIYDPHKYRDESQNNHAEWEIQKGVHNINSICIIF